MLDHKESRVSVETEPALSKSAVITFEPEQIVRAICFHLLDDHHAASIFAISVHHTRDRLRRQSICIKIARRQWETLSNRERLEWLLGQSRTLTLVAGDVISLVPQK